MLAPKKTTALSHVKQPAETGRCGSIIALYVTLSWIISSLDLLLLPPPPLSIISIDPYYNDQAAMLRNSPGRDPVVVLNGLGGAQLKFRLRGAHSEHPYCRSWYATW